MLHKTYSIILMRINDMGVIVDKCADSGFFNALDAYKIKYYKSYNLDYLYKPVNTHPDMQIHFITGCLAVVAPSVYDYYRSILPDKIELHKGEKDPDGTYPGDCAYNVAKVGKKVIGNLAYTDTVIKKIYTKFGFEFINVRQGYTKCNLCVVDKNSVITEDEGLYKTLVEHGIDVLKIPSGEVELKNFDNGFIGGASGFIANKKLAFYGDISKCSYYEKIKSFINSRKVDIIYLSQTKLKDFGSILYFDDTF